MIALALIGQTTACALVLALGVLSDIFDGIIARRLKVATQALRVWDSRADVVFWVCVFVGVVLARPQLTALLWPAAAVIAVLEIGNHLFSFAKFRREASPHHYLSKAFGLTLWGLCSLAFLAGDDRAMMQTAIGMVLVIGVASQIEAFAITLRLKTWRCDVASVLTLKP